MSNLHENTLVLVMDRSNWISRLLRRLCICVAKAHKMPKVERVKSRYSDQYIHAVVTHMSITTRNDTLYFFKTPYILRLSAQLHHTMLFEYLRGTFGNWDDPVVRRDYVSDAWRELVDDSYFARGHVAQFVVDEEMAFWDKYEILNVNGNANKYSSV